MDNSPEQGDLGQSEKSKGKKKADGEGVLVIGTRRPGSKAQGRKRTKSGCLTCRKRRIKCGEEKPTCQNCAKSKRQCEGYNQRVVFKEPVNTFRGPPVSSQVLFSEPPRAVRQNDSLPQPTSTGVPLPIAPKPSRTFSGSFIPTEIVDPLPAATSPGAERRVYDFNSARKRPLTTSNTTPHDSVRKFEVIVDTVDRSRIPNPETRKGKPPDQATHYNFEALEPIKHEKVDQNSVPSAETSPLGWSSHSNASPSTYHPYQSSATWYAPPSTSQSAIPASIFNSSPTTLRSPLEGGDSTSGSTAQYSQEYFRIQQLQQQFAAPGSDWTWSHSRPIPGPEPILPEDDEDPFDVSDEDEDMADTHEGEEGFSEIQDFQHLENNNLGVVVALQARQDTHNLALRSITSYIDRPNMLATYVPSPQSSPLQDPMAARIFCHFINVTGPTMSMFERHPANPSLIFQGRPVPRSQQHIWTYTFPTLALHNQGLLHAMLALASLHIAKLQNGPITASLKHYAYSLRKIGKDISQNNRRGHPATLAAAMLLAFYECWCADHQKWSNHILGAKMLVKGIDFSGMTRHIKLSKIQQRREERERDYEAQQQGFHTTQEPRNHPHGATEDVDENIVSMFMGKKLRYDGYGRILDDNFPDEDPRTYSERDLEIYETQRDLFWWYCKQDVYQSILGGGRLFLEYDHWSHCPPRAPIGRLSATYGTYDHLILLMGRLADFASKDVKRKRLAMKSNGGYRPPGMPPQMPAQHGQQMPPQSQPQMPSFTGMVPDFGEAKLPMGFEPSQNQSPQSTENSFNEDMDLDILRIEAEEEWQEIRSAFSVLEDHFGEDFQALGPEFSPPIQTPFGPALQYRTYGIAGIWLNYYLALITCHRVHPSMPPAAMMAAGIAARNTEYFANEIGRIAAGIAPECGMVAEVSPGVGAALIESSTGLFIAGVQYQSAAQRHWTVDRLRDMARLTGWQTANAVCTGLETSWVKAAEMGKGPPYIRTSDDRIVPDVRRIGDFHMGLVLEWILSVPEIDS